MSLAIIRNNGVDEDNFWACGCGCSEPSLDQELAIISAGLEVKRDEPCPECGGVMRLVQRTEFSFQNRW